MRLHVKQADVLRRRRILDDFFNVDEAQVSYEPYDGIMTAPLGRLVFERGDSAAPAVYHRLIRTVSNCMAYILSSWRSGRVSGIRRVEPAEQALACTTTRA